MSPTSFSHSPSPRCTSADWVGGGGRVEVRGVGQGAKQACRWQEGSRLRAEAGRVAAHALSHQRQRVGCRRGGAAHGWAGRGQPPAGLAHHHGLPVLRRDPHHQPKVEVAQPAVGLHGKGRRLAGAGASPPACTRAKLSDVDSPCKALQGGAGTWRGAAGRVHQPMPPDPPPRQRSTPPHLAQQEVAAVRVAVHHARHQQLQGGAGSRGGKMRCRRQAAQGSRASCKPWVPLSTEHSMQASATAHAPTHKAVVWSCEGVHLVMPCGFPESVLERMRTTAQGRATPGAVSHRPIAAVPTSPSRPLHPAQHATGPGGPH